MKANNPNAPLERDVDEAARATIEQQQNYRRARQVAEIQRKEGEETCINVSVVTGRATSPGTEWNIVVSVTAHRHLNVSVIALRVSVEM